MRKFSIFIALFLANLCRTFGSEEPSIYKEICKDPDEEYLSRLLSNYTILFTKYEQYRYQDPNKVLTLDSESQTIQIKASNFLVDKSECNLLTRNASVINQASLCPWRVKKIFRTTMFPKYMNQIQCTCDSCMMIGSAKIYRNVLSCQPVLKRRPVLFRSKICINGIYRWDSAVEHVGIACVCGFEHRLVPFLKI